METPLHTGAVKNTGRGLAVVVHVPLIPALERWRQADLWVWGQPGLHYEFQESQGFKEKSCLNKAKNKTK